MAPTWKDCFSTAIRLTRFTGHPPFSPRTKLNIFLSGVQYIIEGLLGLRMAVTVLTGEKGIFLGLMVIFLVSNAFIRIIQVNLYNSKYQDYFAEVDDFLRENEFNPITEKQNHFLEIWNREKPSKLTTVILIFTLTLAGLWYAGTVYNAVISKEVARPLYWSPFFETSNSVKWFYIFQEIMPVFTLTYLPWYLNMTFTTIIKFQHAQFIYVKELAISAVQTGYDKQTKEITIWLIKIHQQVLRSMHKVNHLLGLHALTSYFTQILFAVMSIIVLLFKNVTQDDSQKILGVLLSVIQIAEFGYNCIILDRWEEEHIIMRDALFSETLIQADKWQLSTYKILSTRLNKPLTFNGLHIVILNAVTFREMVMSIFSAFTSLKSVLGSRVSGEDE